jgi:membrane-associated protease RseP (regulator of RpoE activity)
MSTDEDLREPDLDDPDEVEAYESRLVRPSSPDASVPASPDEARWKTNLWLFVATVFSVFLTGAEYAEALPKHPGWSELAHALPKGWPFAVPLLAILLCHEFGHYIAARRHGVPASLPYFIPLPMISPLGTMGAVIAMRGRIKSRNALLDIGAAGPLAGLVVAIPVLIIGLARSEVHPLGEHGMQEGQSLLYLLLKRIVLGPIPAGHDVYLSPTAFAGWAGLLMTALNMIPVGQLDGGHIAYALFGEKQNRYARYVQWGLFAAFLYNVLKFVPVAVRTHGDVQQAMGNSAFWLIWFAVVTLLKRLSGGNHPPTDPGELSPKRRGVAIFTLIVFVLLFMPTPAALY